MASIFITLSYRKCLGEKKKGADRNSFHLFIFFFFYKRHYKSGPETTLWHHNGYTLDPNRSESLRFTEDTHDKKNHCAQTDQRHPRMSIIGRARPDINRTIKGYCYAPILSRSFSALIWFLNTRPCLFRIGLDHNSCLFFVLKRHCILRTFTLAKISTSHKCLAVHTHPSIFRSLAILSHH